MFDVPTMTPMWAFFTDSDAVLATARALPSCRLRGRRPALGLLGRFDA